MKDYDLVVVGAGLAGLTAGMFGSRYGLKTAIVDYMASGGQVLNVEKIVDYPGFPQGVAGYELGPLVQEQAEAAGADFYFDTVKSAERGDTGVIVRCAENELQTKSVIIAAGSTFRSLGIPGESELLGKGISHCASCDAPLFAGKEVCVIGGGDSALQEAAVLAEHVARITVFHRGESFGAQQAILEEFEGKANAESQLNTEVLAILGDDAVSGVKLRDVRTGESRVQEISGVFIFAGLEPNTAFLGGLVDLDSGGHVVTDVRLQTSVPGIFAAGDIRQASASQLVSAAGDGATAAVFAHRYVRSLG
ncbi:MAG: FAD-dependent oxidoreductase [Chloroflexota bacterium]|nr:FAD-dependent oxidoreductase [Chloroflexota bacterium]